MYQCISLLTCTYSSSGYVYGHEFVRLYGLELSPAISETAGSSQTSLLSVIPIDVIRSGIELPE